jgi:hypothetical protein
MEKIKTGEAPRRTARRSRSTYFSSVDYGVQGIAIPRRSCHSRFLLSECVGGDQMTRTLTRALGLALLLVSGLVGASFLAAQDSPKQDIKDAGHETKQAAKDTGRATKHAAKKTGRAVKKGTNKAAAKTEEGAHKVKDKTDPN